MCLDEIYRPLFRCNRQPATQHNLLMIAGDLTEARKFHYFVPFLESVIAENGFDLVFYVMGTTNITATPYTRRSDGFRRLWTAARY